MDDALAREAAVVAVALVGAAASAIRSELVHRRFQSDVVAQLARCQDLDRKVRSFMKRRAK